jgi:threonylcarbamoyladenosine tRNA methylthiotransferase MtaB
MKKVALHTLGCKLNFSETSTVGRQFIERGFEIVAPDQPADVFVLNTCSVTLRADRECQQIIRRVLRQSPDAYVIVIGCYAQLQPEELASIDGVDLVLGAREKFSIFEHSSGLRKESLPQVFVSCIDDVAEFAPSSSAEVGNRTRAFLKVQDGCDYRCAFCTIPMARGVSRSQSPGAVLSEAKYLAERGFREIVLTGVNVGDYGTKDGSSLLELVKAIQDVEGIERIRISSMEPNLLTKDMIDFMLASKVMCNHFHIPLQSGSDVVLRRMRRRYSRDHYRDLVEYIKSQDPDAGIGADVIVGFPGETAKFFEETYLFLVDLPVTYLHVFTYSERENTPAAEMEGRVEPRTRSRRNEMLRILGQKKRYAFHRSFAGRTLPVLFESSRPGGRISGLTTNYIRVETGGTSMLTNSIQPVNITSADNAGCTGEISIPSFQTGDGVSNLHTDSYTQSLDVAPTMEFL